MIQEPVARAFVVMAMNDTEIAAMRDQESKFPPTGSYSAWQIAHIFRGNQIPKVLPIEIAAMERLWLDFYTKVLYPQQQEEERLHPQWCCTGKDQNHHTCTMMNCHHKWDDRCKTAAQEMWQWEDYALTHYNGPAAEDVGGVAAKFAAVLVLIGAVLR